MLKLHVVETIHTHAQLKWRASVSLSGNYSPPLTKINAYGRTKWIAKKKLLTMLRKERQKMVSAIYRVEACTNLVLRALNQERFNA